jgi:hypothetical protein
MARDPSCEKRSQLWREYAAATVAHNRIGLEMKMAVKYDAEAIGPLTLEADAALAWHSVAREAIRRHEAEAHPRGSVSA